MCSLGKKIEEDIKLVCKALQNRSRRNSVNTSKLS